MKKCNECGKQYEGNFCPYCGAKWTEEKATERVCPDCGEKVAPGMRFCANCGYDFTGKKSSDDVKAEKKVQAAILRTANFMEAIPTMLRVGNAVLSTIFSVLLWILFALPVTTILEESLGNLYQFMNGTTELGELIEPVKVIGWVIFLAVVALGYALYTLYACVTERKEEKAHTKHWILNLVFLVFHVIFFIVGCIVRSRITGYGLAAGACANSLMICSPIFFVLSLTLTVVSFFLAAKAKAPLTPEEVAAKEAKKAALIEKAKKIAKPVGALGACALAVVIIVSISTNIFRAGKVDNIAIGADAATVLDILGEPYSKDGKAEYSRAGSDTVWKYYGKNYTKIYDKIAELEEKTENMASLGDLDSILEEGLALEEKALALRYKYIEVAFKDGAVVAVYFDMMKCDSDTESKQIGVSSCNIDAVEYSEFSNAKTLTDKTQLQVKYSNGSYLLDTLTVHAEKPSSYYTDGKITWRDAFGEHTQSFKNFVSRPAEVGDVKLVEAEGVTYKYTLKKTGIENYHGEVLLEVTISGGAIPKFDSYSSSSYLITETHMTITEDVSDWGNDDWSGSKNLASFPNITSLILPNNLTNVDDSSIAACENIKYNEDEIAYYIGSNENPYLYLVKVKNSEIVSVDIPETTRFIHPGIFANCTSLTSITIPSSVTTISDDAFADCTSLTSITIPDSVTTIGDYAFAGCSSLTSINIPASVTTISSYAFRGCTGLTSITIPDSVTSIGSYAFYNCTDLKSVTIPDSMTSIGRDPFSGCTSIETATIPDFMFSDLPKNNLKALALTGVTASGEGSYAYLEYLTSITIANGETTIGKYAFSGCTNLTNITIPDSVTTIGYQAFKNCTSLTSITFGENSQLTTIGDNAFFGCESLTSITIPDSVMTIGGSAFSGCTSLAYNEHDKALYLGGSKNPYLYLAKASSTSISSCEIPASVRCIGSSAFAGCTSLTSITIPSSVTTIGDYAFNSCSSLMNITYGENSQLTTIGDYAFEDCTGLTSITIPDSVTSIGERAFISCRGLARVTFGENSQLTTIGGYAFHGCDRLTSITIPASVKAIGDCAFYECTSLTSVHITDLTAWCNISFTSRGNPLIIAHNLYLNGTLVTNLVIPASVTTIGDDAFDCCTSLTSITIPSSVTTIGDDAFYGCKNLTSITIPDSVTYIGEGTFASCTSLTSITFNGTKAQWKNIRKYRGSIGSYWNSNTPTITVHCTDGTVTET